MKQGTPDIYMKLFTCDKRHLIRHGIQNTAADMKVDGPMHADSSSMEKAYGH